MCEIEMKAMVGQFGRVMDNQFGSMVNTPDSSTMKYESFYSD